MRECDPKAEAARGALELVGKLFPGGPASIGIGTGSTVARFIHLARDILRETGTVVGSSLDTISRLRDEGVSSIHPVALKPPVDVYIDGADEVDPSGRLIKGRGAALLGEKILAYSSKVFIVIVDESKLVRVLGERKPLPVEVVRDALPIFLEEARSLGLDPEVRSGKGKDGPVISDWGGVIVDLHTGPIRDPDLMERRLRGIPGVVETGLFLGMTDYVVVGLRSCGWRVVKHRRSRGLSLRGSA